MVQKVKLEDGSIHEFPDDATPEEMSMALESMSPSYEPHSDNQRDPFFGASDMITHGVMQEAQHPSLPSKITRDLALYSTIPEFKLGSAITSRIPGVVSGIGNYLGRIGTQTAGAGAVNAMSNQPGSMVDKIKKGSEEAFPIVAGLETAFGMPGRALGSLAETIKPIEFAKQKIGEFRKEYQDATKLQKKTYDEALGPYKKEEMTNSNPKKFLGFDKETMSYLTPNVKKRYNAFLDKPTIENAHKLQSQMYKASSKMGNNLVYNKESLENARETVKDKIANYLSKDSHALDAYNEASRLTKDVVKPWEENKTIRKIVKGKISDISPSKLHGELEKVIQSESRDIPSSHSIAKTYEELSNKLSRGSAISKILPENLKKWLIDMPGIAQEPYIRNKAKLVGKAATPGALTIADILSQGTR